MEKLNLRGGNTLFDVDLIEKVGSDFIKYSSGILICWGTQTASLPFNVNFSEDQVFANNTYAVVIIPLFNSTAGNGGFWVKNKSTTGFEGTATAGFGKIQWLAVGKWK